MIPLIHRNRDNRRMPLPVTSHVLSRPGYWLLSTLLALFAILILGIDPEQAGATRHHSLETAAPQGIVQDIALPPPAAGVGTADTGSADESTAPVLAAGTWHEVTVSSGDSIARLFANLDLPPQQLDAIVSRGGAAKNLEKIHPGQQLRFLVDEYAGLLRLEMQIDRLTSVVVKRTGDEFEVVTEHLTPEKRQKHASGTIDSSLFLAGQAAGLSDKLTMELADIFGWDIDFALDIREGDRFTVLYEELYHEGEKIEDGRILAAEFVNDGKLFRAVRYAADGDAEYYAPDGKPMRKAFLRTPVKLARISSRFSLGRRHPILNKIRAHKGVDYAAPTGTPVRATGDGKIIHRGTKGGYGNTIIIQHANKYSTLYAHLSRYKGGQRRGSRVRQGQVIGYIGSTGLATGPHLHYEFRVNGAHRDPLRVKLPGAPPLPAEYRDEFQAEAARRLAQLDTVRGIQVASNR